MLTEEERSPHSNENKYDDVKGYLGRGDVEKWDVTTLTFALLDSHALSEIRDSNSERWNRERDAIHKIRQSRNDVSHFAKLSSNNSNFQKRVGKLVQAVKDLLPQSHPSESHPLVDEMKGLQRETEFQTVDLVKCKNSSQNRSKYEIPGVDLVPSRSKPSIFRNKTYIMLMNKVNSLLLECRDNVACHLLRRFISNADSIDMLIYAEIKLAEVQVVLDDTNAACQRLDRLTGMIARAKHG